MDNRGRGATGIMVGAVGGSLLTAAALTLLSSKPAQAASDDEKIDYLIKLAEVQALSFATLVDTLQSMDKTAKDMREIAGVDFAFDPMRYFAWKLRSGEGYANRGSYYVLLPGGATFTIDFIMPEGYVWIGARESIEVSQNGIFEFTRTTDRGSLPSFYAPRIAYLEINWATTLPFGFVIREIAELTYTNHDLANQWFISTFFGIYLRKDVWEHDSKLMDLAAVKYSTPPEVNCEQ